MPRFGANTIVPCFLLGLLFWRLLRASPHLARVKSAPVTALAHPSPVRPLASALASQDAREGARDGRALPLMAMRPFPSDAPSDALLAHRPGPPILSCAPGCEANGGNCDRRSGRCDCPPLRAGEACERSAVPMCAEQWGLVLPVPPCQALMDEPSDWREFPPTCE
eukprot:scaffold1250_cov106-Isochrysis_galbana.AAC.4